MSIAKYLKDVQAEMSHVAWPTKQHTLFFTLIVVGISIFSAAYLGLFDTLFSQILSNLI